ncbi:MAG TPA: organomercurial lyase [Gemmatimonadota bacterium]|nr:organomercurial lyase [Gemmatimonadota bacterium]
MSHEPDPTLDRDVRLEVYRHFVQTGRAPTAEVLATALGVPEREIRRSLRRLADAHLLVLSPGTALVWMAHPFSAVPTDFGVRVGGRRYWANCAWDALAIGPLLGEDAVIDAHCPDCREPLRLRIEDGRLAPTGAVVHFAVPPARFWENIGFT